MQRDQGFVKGSPFDEVHKNVFQFAFGLQEDATFQKLYESPESRDSAINFLITSPKMYEQIPS